MTGIVNSSTSVFWLTAVKTGQLNLMLQFPNGENANGSTAQVYTHFVTVTSVSNTQHNPMNNKPLVDSQT